MSDKQREIYDVQTNNSMKNFLPEDYVEKRQSAPRGSGVFIGLLLVVVGGILASLMVTISSGNTVLILKPQKRKVWPTRSKRRAS